MINEEKKKKGFANMTREKRVAIAAKGGFSAHRLGVAHTWTKEEARVAGAKGGRMNLGKTRGGGNL